MLLDWLLNTMHNDVCDSPENGLLATPRYHIRKLLRVYWRRIIEPECTRTHSSQSDFILSPEYFVRQAKLDRDLYNSSN